MTIAVVTIVAVLVAVGTGDGPTGLIESGSLRGLEIALAAIIVIGLVVHRPADGLTQIGRAFVACGVVVIAGAFVVLARDGAQASRLGGPLTLDVFAMLVAPLAVAALLGVARPRHQGMGPARVAIDGAVIACSTVVLGWYVAVRPLRDADVAVDLSSTTALAFLVLDAMAFALGLLLLSRAPYTGRSIVAVGVVGLALLLFADVARIVQFLPGQPQSSLLSEIGWIGALACFAVAAWQTPRRNAPVAAPADVAVGWPWWLTLPSTFLLPVAGVLVVAAIRRDADALMIVCAAAIIIVLGFRHVIALRENEELTGRLRTSVHQLARRAEHDELTGLLNRRGLSDRLGRLRLRKHPQFGLPVTVLFIDIDRFKGVNDSLGHTAGDTVLRAIGMRLSQLAEGRMAVAARFAGDEFVLLFPGLGSEAEALSHAQDALDLVERPIPVADRGEIIVTASAGVAVSGRLEDGDGIIREADLAMFEAKSGGRARVQLFEEDLRQRSEDRMQIEQEMRRSLATTSEFEVHLQPLVRLDGDRIWGVEALVRWRHPTRGTLNPGRFLSVAEESGMIIPLGERVLSEACAAAVAVPGLIVSVNLSPRQLHDPALVRMVRGQLDLQGLPPERLCLEVTEEALVDSRAISVLEDLQRIGVRVAIDDFGVGASSFRQLRRLPGALVKIDRSFIERLDDDSGSDDRVMVKAMVSLAQQLGLQVIAEGIERQAQMEIVRELGVTIGQGWYLGAPKRAAAFVTERGGRPMVRRSLPQD